MTLALAASPSTILVLPPPGLKLAASKRVVSTADFDIYGAFVPQWVSIYLNISLVVVKQNN